MSDFNWNGFDAEKAVEENPPRNYEPVQTGWYPTIIIDGEWKPTNGKSGPGRMLVLQAEIVEGQHKGSHCWTNFNLVNNNPAAVKIAEGLIGQLAVSVGVLHPRDHSELCRRPVLAKWALSPEKKETEDSPGYPAKNEIKEFKRIGSVANTAAPSTPAARPEATAAATAPDQVSNKKPWEK